LRNIFVSFVEISMKEQEFIDKNKDSWQAFEQDLKNPRKKPENFWRTFMKITGDLAYARTFYPNRSVRVYLNYLSQLVFNDLNKNKKRNANALSEFWLRNIPMALYNNRAALYLSLCIFVFSFAAGYLSSLYHPEYIEKILGIDYVTMTQENIARGDPMAVYKQMAPFEMSFAITFNNIRVAFLTFITGLFASIGSVGILLYNGMMIAAFHKLLFNHGIVSEMLLTVYMHGTMEISAIIIAGGAGLVLGKGLLFPGSYTRLQAFQKYSKEAIYIFIGTLPLFLLAGLIEGFITRLTELPDLLRFIFILSTLALVIVYYFIYPIILRQREKSTDHEVVEEPFQTGTNQISFTGTKSLAEIIKQAFRVYRVHFPTITFRMLLISMLSTFVFSILLFNQHQWSISSGEIMLDWESMLFDSSLSDSIFFIMAGFTGLWFLASDRVTDAYHAKIPFNASRKIIYYIGVLLIASLTAGLFFASGWFSIIIQAFFIGLLYLFVIGIGRSNPAVSSIMNIFVNTLRYGISGILVLMITGAIFAVFLYFIAQSGFVLLTIEILTWTIQMNTEWRYFWSSAIQWTLSGFVFLGFLFLCKLFIELLFTHINEILTADSLNRDLEIFGEMKKMNGIQFEK
jgi:uncharacterized membrane protein SpoIIM required for sporulation